MHFCRSMRSTSSRRQIDIDAVQAQISYDVVVPGEESAPLYQPFDHALITKRSPSEGYNGTRFRG
jgi:hypothetical protein